ncbi:MAG: DUF2750 domain-containing protein [Verrucomicrobia bacterium]|nr:DUF2750 domain-containing protein [Verrucomicrobiota bacterium]
MSWTPKEREIEALVAADGKRRYEYFIHRVCDSRRIWSLFQDGWASLGDGDRKLIPFWPHAAYASLFKTGDWASYEPKAIELDEFLRDWIPGMQKEGVAPAIFPVGTGSSILVSFDDLKANLKAELSKYGGVD